jgi:hypothetical protein
VKYDKYDPENPTIWEDDIQDMPKKWDHHKTNPKGSMTRQIKISESN